MFTLQFRIILSMSDLWYEKLQVIKRRQQATTYYTVFYDTDNLFHTILEHGNYTRKQVKYNLMWTKFIIIMSTVKIVITGLMKWKFLLP